MSKIKRSQFRSFINTGTILVPVWELVGEGVKGASIAYNPKTTEETYVHEDSASIIVDSYAPNFPVEATAIDGDGVFEFLEALRVGRSILSDAEAEIANVWLYQTSISLFYPAERQPVSLQIEEFGGEGGAAAKLNYTVNFIGEPTLGRFCPVAPYEWSELNAATANILSTLVLGSGTLSPLFATDPSNLFYTTSIAAATVQMDSTLAGATIVQECNGVEVAQGDDANLNLGVNYLTISVTVDTVEYIYRIEATRTV